MTLESITIKKCFDDHRISFTETQPNGLEILCPFCRKDNLQINLSGEGCCRSCKEDSIEFQEITEALEIEFKYKIKNIENGSIYYLKDDQKQEQYLPPNTSESEIESENRFMPITLKDLYQKIFPKVQWLVEGIIPLAGITAISGIPGSYKSWLVEHLAVSIASNSDFLGHFKTSINKVLIVDEEDNEALLQSRLRLLGADESLPIYFLSLNNIKIDEKKDLNELMGLVKKLDIKLIIFDSLVRIHNQDENTATGMGKVFEAFKAFIREDITCVFTHHHRKSSSYTRGDVSQSLRGSSDILAGVSCHLAIEKEEGFIVILQTKLRQQIMIKPFKVVVKSDDNNFQLEYVGEHDEIEIKKREIKEKIMELLSNATEELDTKTIHEHIESPEKLLRVSLNELTDFGKITCIIRAHNKKFYSIKADADISSDISF